MPKGTETLFISSPLGLLVSNKVWPVGSGNRTISSTDLAIFSILISSSISLLIIASDKPLFLAKTISSLFALMISLFLDLILSAILNKSLFLSSVERD